MKLLTELIKLSYVLKVDQLTELMETLKLQHEEEVGGLREALAREIDSARDEVADVFYFQIVLLCLASHRR